MICGGLFNECVVGDIKCDMKSHCSFSLLNQLLIWLCWVTQRFVVGYLMICGGLFDECVW